MVVSSNELKHCTVIRVVGVSERGQTRYWTIIVSDPVISFGTRAETAGIPWEYRKVLLGHEIQDVTAHYSAPGLARLLDQAERILRQKTPILRPVAMQSPCKEKRQAKK